MSLLADVEAVFASSEQRVLAVFQVVKCEPAQTTIRGRKLLPKSTNKQRVLCLTAKRRSKKRGFKGTLHICKLSPGGRLQVRKSFKLKHLLRMEAFVDSPGQQEYLELSFHQRGFTSSDVRLAFEVRNAAVRLELLGALHGFCRTHEKKPPTVTGVDRSELDVAAALFDEAAGHAGGGGLGRESGTLGLPPRGRAKRDGEAAGEGARRADFAAAAAAMGLSLTGDDALKAGKGLHPLAAEREANPLWGQREDKQVQSMLEMISTGASSVGELRERLAAELAALEDAQVHEILETERGPMVERVLVQVEDTLGLLDDLEENLNIFDAKLRHMREDITAIEGRNNALELHSRNNARLVGTLQDLVARLSLPRATEDLLRTKEVTASNLSSMVEAAWVLQRHLEALSPAAIAAAADSADSAAAAAVAEGGSSADGCSGPLPRELADMRAVAQQRQKLHSLMRLFLDKASSYLSYELGHLGEGVLARVNAAGGAQRTRRPEHGELRRRAAALAPLLEVVRAMRPAAVAPLRDAYTSAMNALLRREVHVAVSEYKRMAAAAEAGGAAGEPDLMAAPKGSDGAARTLQTLERMSSAAPVRPGASADTSSLGRPSHQRTGSSFRGLASLASSPADLQAPLREGGVVPVHEGYQALLESHLPLLAEEVQQCISLLFPRTVRVQAPAAGGDNAHQGAHARSVHFAEQQAQGSGGTQAETVDSAAAAAAAVHEVPLDPNSRDVQAVVSGLLAGVDAELLGLVDSIKPSRSLLCLPMLGSTLDWQQRLAAKPGCQPLCEALLRCERRLRQLFEEHVAERVLAVQRYDGKTGLASSSNVKAQHVLPFVVNFPAVAARAEELLRPWLQAQAEPAAATAAAAAGREQAISGRAAAGTSTPGLPPTSQQQPQRRLPFSPFETGGASSPSSSQGGTVRPGTSRRLRLSSDSTGETAGNGGTSEEVSFMTTEDEEHQQAGSSRRTTSSSAEGHDLQSPQQKLQQPPAQQAGTQPRVATAVTSSPVKAPAGQPQPGGSSPGRVLRECADGMYERLSKAIFAALDALGQTDAKHGQRLRLENHAFLLLGLQTLPTQDVPVLAACLQQAAALEDAAMAAYIEQQVDYFKFTRILEFSRKLDSLMQTVGREEIHFQQHFTPAEVRALLSSTVAGLDKKLVQVHGRIRKHLAATSPYLVDQVWGKLEGICLARWARMEEQLRLCYPGIPLQPPLAEMRRLFQAAARSEGS